MRVAKSYVGYEYDETKAYEKNGKMYNGIVKADTISTLPNGVWYSHPTAIVYDVEDVENIEEVESICDAMTKFSSYDDLTDRIADCA